MKENVKTCKQAEKPQTDCFVASNGLCYHFCKYLFFSSIICVFLLHLVSIKHFTLPISKVFLLISFPSVKYLDKSRKCVVELVQQRISIHMAHMRMNDLWLKTCQLHDDLTTDVLSTDQFSKRRSLVL